MLVSERVDILRFHLTSFRLKTAKQHNLRGPTFEYSTFTTAGAT